MPVVDAPDRQRRAQKRPDAGCASAAPPSARSGASASRRLRPLEPADEPADEPLCRSLRLGAAPGDEPLCAVELKALLSEFGVVEECQVPPASRPGKPLHLRFAASRSAAAAWEAARAGRLAAPGGRQLHLFGDNTAVRPLAPRASPWTAPEVSAAAEGVEPHAEKHSVGLFLRAFGEILRAAQPPAKPTEDSQPPESAPESGPPPPPLPASWAQPPEPAPAPSPVDRADGGSETSASDGSGEAPSAGRWAGTPPTIRVALDGALTPEVSMDLDMAPGSAGAQPASDASEAPALTPGQPWSTCPDEALAAALAARLAKSASTSAAEQGAPRCSGAGDTPPPRVPRSWRTPPDMPTPTLADASRRAAAAVFGPGRPGPAAGSSHGRRRPPTPPPSKRRRLFMAAPSDPLGARAAAAQEPERPHAEARHTRSALPFGGGLCGVSLHWCCIFDEDELCLQGLL